LNLGGCRGAIRLKGTLTADRRLLVNIPDHIPAGEIGLFIEMQESMAEPNEATAKARAKLAAAGALSSTLHMTTVRLFLSLRENYQKLSKFSNIGIS